MKFDYEYLCDNLGHLSGLQTRIYKGESLLYEYIASPLKFDLIKLIRTELFMCEKTVSFFEASDILIFGKIFVPKENIRIIIGPTTVICPTEAKTRAILREMGEPGDALPALNGYFTNMVNYPLENFLQILIFVNYALNDVKTGIGELLEQQTYMPLFDHAKIPDGTTAQDDGGEVHNTYEIEQKLMSFVKYGKTAEIEAMFSRPPTGRAGKMAHDDLRQQKNLIICVATLASRAAIAGGLSHETAFTLSDKYIRKAELMDSITSLSRLNMQMLLDFAKHVEQLKFEGVRTPFADMVNAYVSKNIDRSINTLDLAAAMGYSRQHFCGRFKKETGMTVNEFITVKKIDEARRLLEAGDSPLSQISEYLSFSSQSYFQNVFKKHTGMTPVKYREYCAL